MILRCPNELCKNRDQNQYLKGQTKRIRLSGYYFRSSDSRRIRRYHCLECGRYFSASTYHPAKYQKKRRINALLMKYLCSGVSQRRSAILLHVNPKTVARRLSFLSQLARAKQTKMLAQLNQRPIAEIQFDDLETAEHTKCKPISVSLAVEAKTRFILGYEAYPMPAKGHLARISRMKYGVRLDERPKGWNNLFSHLKLIIEPDSTIHSDQNPHYTAYVQKYFPHSKHFAHKGRRGCVAGQGELKKIGFDPLFSLNHTCAMFRANINRLFRRTWCLSKKIECLKQHIDLYVCFHNQSLLRNI